MRRMAVKPPPTSLPTFSVSFPEPGDYTDCRARRGTTKGREVEIPWPKTPEDFASALAEAAAEAEDPSYPGVGLTCPSASSSWDAGGNFYSGRLEIPSLAPGLSWVIECNLQGHPDEQALYGCSASLGASGPVPPGPRPWMPSVDISTADYGHRAPTGARAGPVFPCALEAGSSAKIWCNLRGG